METTSILKADLLDIVFDGRNKSYGAYELRKNYQRRMTKALIITFGICSMIAGGAWLKSVFGKEEKTTDLKIIPDVIISDIKEIKEELPPPPPPPPAPKVEVPKIKAIDFTTPIVTSEPVVEPPPTQEDLITARISNITQEGVLDNNIVAPLEGVDGKRGLMTSVVKKEDDLPFTKVEIDAAYLGNWKSYLERNLSGEAPIDNGAAPGVYTVVIQFVVDVNGSISDMRALTNHGFGMEQEAMRVIKKSGKWRPAIQNNREVKAYRKQPITFQVLEQ